MQRVRIGLTGLGFVFVAVLLATAFTREPEAEAPITANGIAGVAAEPAVNTIGPQDPLAELGVAPRGDANAVAGNAVQSPQ